MDKIIFFDTETTGKDPDDRLIQLCYKTPIGDPVTMLFKPNRPIKFEAMATHHITEAMVKDADIFSGSPMFFKLQDLAKDFIFVAHNAQFDLQILKNEGIEVPKFIDTLKLARFFYPEEPMHKLQYLRYRLGINIEAQAHDAEGDVLVLQMLFHHFCELRESARKDDPDDNFDKCLEWMQEITKQPSILHRLAFGKHKGLLFSEVPKDYLRWLLGQKDIDPDLRITCELALNPKK